MLWTWFFARSSGIHLPWIAVAAMGTAVWLLYATDRLLDSRREGSLEPRHLFHHHNRWAFRAGVCIAGVALAAAVTELPMQSVRLYAVLGTHLLTYFAVIHLQRSPAPPLPKEIAVGVFFSAATFIPTIARNQSLRLPLLPVAILFGMTCSLNCLFIYQWEHLAPFAEAHPATRIALRHLRPLTWLVILGSFVLALRPGPRQLPFAIAIAASLLLLLHRTRRHLDSTTLRAAADLCLLTPLLMIFTLPS